VNFVASFVDRILLLLLFSTKLTTKLATKSGGAAGSGLHIPPNLFEQALVSE